MSGIRLGPEAAERLEGSHGEVSKERQGSITSTEGVASGTGPGIRTATGRHGQTSDVPSALAPNDGFRNSAAVRVSMAERGRR